MKTAMVFVAFVLSVVLLQSTALPQAQTVDSVLAQMEKANMNYPYIQAKIESRNYTAFVNLLDKDAKTGKIWISRTGKAPRQIKIDYEKPFRELVLIDKGKLLKYAPNTKNGTSFSFNKEDQAEAECIALGLCQSVDLIKQSYTITFADKPEIVPGVKTTVLDLTPKEKKRASLIKSIRLWLDSSKWYPVQTRAFAPNGNYRNSIFSEISISNKPFAASVFELKPPKDADIQVIKELKF